MERAEYYVRCALIIISIVLEVFKSSLFWRHQFIKCWTSSLYAVSLFDICPTLASKFDNGVCVMYGRIVMCEYGVEEGLENAALGCVCVEWSMKVDLPILTFSGCWGSQEQARRNINSLWDFFWEVGGSLLIRLEAHWLPGNSSLRPLLHVHLAKSLNRFGTAKANYLNCLTLSVSVQLTVFNSVLQTTSFPEL